jgi:hypothetical protein
MIFHQVIVGGAGAKATRRPSLVDGAGDDERRPRPDGAKNRQRRWRSEFGERTVGSTTSGWKSRSASAKASLESTRSATPHNQLDQHSLDQFRVAALPARRRTAAWLIRCCRLQETSHS